MTTSAREIGGFRTSERPLAEPLGEAIGNRLVGRIRQLIVELAPGIEPGQRNYFQQMAQQFGIRVTPILYALQRLEEKRTVRVRPRSGHYRTEFAEDDCQEIIRVRIALEQDAMRLIVGSGIRQGLLDAPRHVAARP